MIIKVSYGNPGGSWQNPFNVDWKSGEYVSKVEARVGDHTDSVRFVTNRSTDSIIL